MSRFYCDDNFPHAHFELNKRAKKIVAAVTDFRTDCFGVDDVQAFYRFAQELRHILDEAEDENKFWLYWNK